MRIKLLDDLKLRPRERLILSKLLSQFLNGHLFEALCKRISLRLLTVEVRQLTELVDPISVTVY